MVFDDSFMRLREVCQATGLSRSTIYERMKNGTFVRPVHIGTRSVRWRVCDIRGWLRTEFEAGRGTGQRAVACANVEPRVEIISEPVLVKAQVEEPVVEDSNRRGTRKRIVDPRQKDLFGLGSELGKRKVRRR